MTDIPVPDLVRKGTEFLYVMNPKSHANRNFSIAANIAEQVEISVWDVGYENELTITHFTKQELDELIDTLRYIRQELLNDED